MTITSISSILGSLGEMGSIFGTKCCNFIKSNRTRVKVKFISGTFFILAGILQLNTLFLCEVYNSMGYWEYVLQPARAMIPTAIILVVLGVMVSMVGAKSTNCIKDKTSQAKLIIIAAILFILAGFLILIPVSLVARSIISDSSTRIEGKPELGNSLYLGWVAASLLLIGGVLLCCNCIKSNRIRVNIVGTFFILAGILQITTVTP
ncbi:claudin-4-like [Salvelinus namaycush]|uniref:Claudin-4-like n=1 Tax=Salvelinus namaycush TaxID=8040 RepID=A0A8U0PA37_SALNM|nr:claudin-4-like [Salvelinus namaycush]